MNTRYFAQNYEESRQKFIEFTSNAPLYKSFPLKDDQDKDQLVGKNGEPLYIDICVYGNIKNPSSVLLHTVGVHGVESFGSSAIQLKVLYEKLNSNQIDLKNTAAIFIHTVNPYVNSCNVDLNRNFFYDSFEDKIEGKSKSPYEERGTNPTYSSLNTYLNPKFDDISIFDSISFYLKTCWNFWNFMASSFEQHLLEGQNSYPDGLFFGGTKLEQEPKIIFQFLTEFLTKTIPGSNLKKLIHIDTHTGVGFYGQDCLLVDDDSNGKYSRVFGSKVKSPQSDPHNAIMVKGTLNSAVRDICQRLDVPYYGMCHEFGTYSFPVILRALRVENAAFQKQGERMETKSNEKMNLLKTFYPDDDIWRLRCINSGFDFMRKCLAMAEE